MFIIICDLFVTILQISKCVVNLICQIKIEYTIYVHMCQVDIACDEKTCLGHLYTYLKITNIYVL